MISVKDNENTIVIKNSKFICILRYVDSVDMATKLIGDTKRKYNDATHCCYAYVINNISKCSDDGEPSGTAGIPILQVLKNNNLNNVLCIVVRYFGKILLGASGLVRAYTRSVSECLNGNIINLSLGYNITLLFDYNHLKDIDYILKDINIIYKKYEDKIIYNLNVSISIYDKLVNLDFCDVVINSNVYL